MASVFDIIETEDITFLKQRVNESLQNGWELHGDLKVFQIKTVDYEGGFRYIQAIVKDDAKGYGVRGKVV